MAYDKIRVIHTRLDNAVRYVLNREKTALPETGRALESAVNCTVETAYRDMLNTKRRWDKVNGVQGYHIIHSFAPGEVTPERAHAIGVELAERLLKGRFEAVIATHLDHGHVHCHIVFNSVSCTDGKMYRDDFKAYFHDIRGISNHLSRENDLSVIEPKGRGKDYSEWNAEKNGRPTVRGLVRRDIDAALANSISLHTLFAALEKQGYTVKRGPNVKHTAVKPPGSDRFVRLDSLGSGYTEADLRKKIEKGLVSTPSPEPEAQNLRPIYIRRTYRVGRKTSGYKRRIGGFRRLYLHYLYLLAPPRPVRRRPPPFPVRAEVRRLEQYKRQFALLFKYRIDNESQLSMLADALQADIDSLVLSRRQFYRRQRQGEDVAGEIKTINLTLRPIRRELKCCQTIRDTIPQIQEQLRLDRQTGQAQKEAKSKTKERRNEQWK